MSERTSHDLTARAADLAVRVADLLDQRCSVESGAAQTAEFLRAWGKQAQADRCEEQPFDLVAARFGLTEQEQQVLLLAGLAEEHEGIAGTFRALHPRGEPHPTTGLAALLLGGDRAAVRRLLTEGAAVRAGLLRFGAEGTFFERSITVADRLWEALHGHEGWPASIERVPVEPAPGGLDRWLAWPQVRRVAVSLLAADDRTVLVATPEEEIALSRCAAVADAAGTPLVAGRVAAQDPHGIALLAAHAAARGAIPVLVLAAHAEGTPPATLRIAAPGPVLVVSGGPVRAVGHRPLLTLPTGPLDGTDHRATWAAALPRHGELAPALAARHAVDPAHTTQIAADLREPVDLAQVASAIRARAGAVLPAGVDLSTPDVPWHRLVLPQDQAGQLRAAVDRLEQAATVLDDWGFRARANASGGTRLLFTGPPGTGKSLAAQAVSSAAGTDLLTVDVSRVVSKWIGETEKNLASVFEVAQRTQAVLFMDEADALFGTRTEIGDAHDRYANLETAYLLQRLDRFDGVVLLASNLRHNIDPAFLRRMDLVVEFPQPDESCRHRLWDLHLPERVRGPDVDLAVLSRLYPVAGGWIRNAVIAAGFAAAPAGPVRQHHLVAAMRREYAKAGQPFPGEPTNLMETRT
ncbi:ATP-binding protein [Kutzneria albida]|uniref:AAA+ ATPase domain-containing protein n=1 Tax=Kutzneria albida DSM 43870 TaxID=1449976 RepID=W5WFD6_9PSEU|nr:ATP-binding protein [Kutzneria albida]AHH99465.1 hypothetical protein KALB_6105 [Kutzneria albida DSM 43870]